MTTIIQAILDFKAIIVGFSAAIVSIFLIRRDLKNEIKNQQLQDRIEEINRTRKYKNDFNNLDNDEQSKWLLDNLKKKRDKFPK